MNLNLNMIKLRCRLPLLLLVLLLCVPQVEARRSSRKAKTEARAKRGKKSRSRKSRGTKAAPKRVVYRPTATDPMPGLGASASVGIYVKDLTTGRIVMDHNAGKVLTPASTMKCVTAASGLLTLGADHRFNTLVSLDGDITGDKLTGDITIYSSGDPTLDSRHLPDSISFVDDIIAALHRQGIRNIEGCVVVNETFEEPGPCEKWEIEDVAYNYGSGIYGLNWRDNTFTLWPATGRTSVPVPGLEVKLTRGGRRQLRGFDSWRINVGAPNTSDSNFAISTTMPWPAESLEAELLQRLAADSIWVVEPVDTVNAPHSRVLLEHRSRPLSEILRSMMVRSDNLYAEGVLRALSPAGRDSALSVERHLLDSLGVDFADAIIYDGSGLTRANKLSPRMLGDLLEYMTKRPEGALYVSLFPKAGVEGTVRKLMHGTSLEGQFVLKSGSVSGVQCFAGYKLDAEGRPTHVVVIMANGFRSDHASVRAASQRLLLYLFGAQAEADEAPSTTS